MSFVWSSHLVVTSVHKSCTYLLVYKEAPSRKQEQILPPHLKLEYKLKFEDINLLYLYILHQLCLPSQVMSDKLLILLVWACLVWNSESMSRAHFPKGFTFGTASSAYQVLSFPCLLSFLTYILRSFGYDLCVCISLKVL